MPPSCADNREDPVWLNEYRLFHHVFEKGFQAGSVVGIPISAALCYRSARKGGPADAAKFFTLMGRSALIGIALAGVMGAARVAQIPSEEMAEGMQDRAYRLHFNNGQNRTDMFAEVGMAAGGSLAMYFVSPAAAVVVGGASAGAVVGILAHLATSKMGKDE